jgi:hypothetical protein
VNPWLWYLVLDRKTRGRYTSLAGLAGQRILDVSPSSYDRDTAALGLFVAGRHEAALAAQEGSLATAAGSATPGMARRLHIYREVVAGERAAAAQRVAAPRGAKTRRDGR